MRHVASRPFIPGIETSITTIPGLCVCAASTAPRPSSSSARISTPGCASSRERSPARKIGWSSARRMRIAMGPCGSAERHVEDGAGSLARSRFDLEAASDLGAHLPEGEEAEPPGLVEESRLLAGVEAFAVVGDDDPDSIPVGVQAYLCVRRPGVPHDVLAEYADGAVEQSADILAELRLPVRFDAELDAALLPEPLAQALDGGCEPELVEHRRAQLEGERAGLRDGAIHERADLAGPARDVATRPNLHEPSELGPRDRQDLTHFVVQARGDAPALTLLRQRELQREAPQLLAAKPALGLRLLPLLDVDADAHHAQRLSSGVALHDPAPLEVPAPRSRAGEEPMLALVERGAAFEVRRHALADAGAVLGMDPLNEGVDGKLGRTRRVAGPWVPMRAQADRAGRDVPIPAALGCRKERQLDPLLIRAQLLLDLEVPREIGDGPDETADPPVSIPLRQRLDEHVDNCTSRAPEAELRLEAADFLRRLAPLLQDALAVVGMQRSHPAFAEESVRGEPGDLAHARIHRETSSRAIRVEEPHRGHARKRLPLDVLGAHVTFQRRRFIRLRG